MIETVEVNASFIPLTQSKVAIVDTEDYNYLNQWKWHAKRNGNTHYTQRQKHLGYINRKQKQTTIIMHRILLNPPKGKIIDHINGNGLDNRKSNLRVVSHRQNTQNQKHRKNKKSSKYPGVCWNKSNQKWVALIRLNGKQKYLGTFIDERKAAKAYETALRKNIGEELVCKSNI